jgi:hypothetical protein
MASAIVMIRGWGRRAESQGLLPKSGVGREKVSRGGLASPGMNLFGAVSRQELTSTSPRLCVKKDFPIPSSMHKEPDSCFVLIPGDSGS